MFSCRHRFGVLANYALSYVLGSYYTTALHRAVEAQNANEVVRLVKEEGIYVDLTTSSNMGLKDYIQINVTPLHVAANLGHYEILLVLLNNGADPHLTSTSNDPSMRPWIWNALHFALFRGHLHIAEFLITECKLEIDDTALEVIEKNGLINTIGLLQQYTSSTEAFFSHIRHNHYEIEAIKWYKQSSNRESLTSEMALYSSVLRGDLKRVEGLLTLFSPCFTNKLQLTLFNIQQADINEKIRLNSVYCQKFQDNSRTISVGVSDFDETENTNKLPILFIAILTANCDLDVVQVLLAHGADPLQTINGTSALELMEIIFEEKIIELNLPERNNVSIQPDCSARTFQTR